MLNEKKTRPVTGKSCVLRAGAETIGRYGRGSKAPPSFEEWDMGGGDAQKVQMWSTDW